MAEITRPMRSTRARNRAQRHIAALEEAEAVEEAVLENPTQSSATAKTAKAANDTNAAKKATALKTARAAKARAAKKTTAAKKSMATKKATAAQQALVAQRTSDRAITRQADAATATTAARRISTSPPHRVQKRVPRKRRITIALTPSPTARLAQATPTPALVVDSPLQGPGFLSNPFGATTPLRPRLHVVAESSPYAIPNDYEIDTAIELKVDGLPRPTGILDSSRTRNKLRFVDIDIAFKLEDLRRELIQQGRGISAIEYLCILLDKRHRMSTEKIPRKELDFDTEQHLLSRCDIMHKDSNKKAILSLRVICKVLTQTMDPLPGGGGIILSTPQQSFRPGTTPVDESVFRQTPPAPSTRRTRTTQLMETREDQRAVDRAGMVTIEQLQNRWICEDEDCLRQGRHCWIHPQNPSKHYPIERLQFQTWAHQISIGEASLGQPHFNIKERLVKNGTVIEQQSKAKAKAKGKGEGNRSSNDDLFDLVKAQLAIGLSAQTSQAQQAAQYHTAQLQAMQFRREEPFYALAKDQRPLSRSGVPGAAIPQRQLSSSPIRGDVDDSEVIRQFFKWKVERCQNDDIARENWVETSLIVRQHGWSISDLKLMEVEESKRHAEAIEAQLKAPIVRQFRRQLDKYKEWCTQERAQREGEYEDNNENERI